MPNEYIYNIFSWRSEKQQQKTSILDKHDPWCYSGLILVIFITKSCRKVGAQRSMADFMQYCAMYLDIDCFLG